MDNYFIDLFLSSLGDQERKNAPKNIFYQGNSEFLNQGIKIAVVGSRKVSKEGIERTKIVTKELVKNGIIVVSGLASGVDTIAHETAISMKGRTIAVLGTPLNQCTPVSNKPLLERIKLNHLAISQFEEDSSVYRKNFVQRNKTMALVSDGTVIIEASENSGTQHQAWEALRLGRSLFIMENVANDPQLTWPNKMIEYGAVVLTRANYKMIFEFMAEGDTVQL